MHPGNPCSEQKQLLQPSNHVDPGLQLLLSESTALSDRLSRISAPAKVINKNVISDYANKKDFIENS